MLDLRCWPLRFAALRPLGRQLATGKLPGQVAAQQQQPDPDEPEHHTQHGQRVVLGPLVFSIGIGMTVADVSGKAIANLEIERIVHEAPTFIGDTLYSESTVLAKRESSKGDRGTVSVETRVVNQRGEPVMEATVTRMIKRT